MSFLVLTDLRSRLNDAYQNWLLQQKNSERKTPAIYIGQLPPKTGSAPPDKSNKPQAQSGEAPFILIRSIDGGLEDQDIGSALYHFNVALIFCIYSEDSFSNYESGVQSVMDFLDKAILSISKYQFWGDSKFYIDSEMNWSFGLGKTIDPYECGLQTEAPYFAAVLNLSFNRSLNLPKIEIEHLI